MINFVLKLVVHVLFSNWLFRSWNEFFNFKGIGIIFHFIIITPYFKRWVSIDVWLTNLLKILFFWSFIFKAVFFINWNLKIFKIHIYLHRELFLGLKLILTFWLKVVTNRFLIRNLANWRHSSEDNWVNWGVRGGASRMIPSSFWWKGLELTALIILRFFRGKLYQRIHFLMFLINRHNFILFRSFCNNIRFSFFQIAPCHTSKIFGWVSTLVDYNTWFLIF